MNKTLSPFLFPFGKFSNCQFLVYFQLFFGIFSFAEGTKQVAPNPTDVTALYTNNIAFGSFASYNGPAQTRINVHIADPTNELVYFGFSQRMLTSNGNDGTLVNSTYYFRLIDPNGNIVFGPQAISSTTVNANSWTLASNGPAPIVGAGGYTPFTYIPSGGAIAGDYFIEFSTNANFSSNSNSNLSIKYWDITVASQTVFTQIDGRVWSEKWALRTPSIAQGADPTFSVFDRPYNGKIYTYDENGFVFEVDFDGAGFRGLSFNLSFNDFGTIAETNLGESRKSDNNVNTTSGQYKLFINNPDVNVYPTGVFGSIEGEPFVETCPGEPVCISFAVTENGQVEILLDFDSNSGAGVYDPGTADVLIFEKVERQPGETSPLERCVEWDGRDGLGNPVSLSNQVPIYLDYYQGVVHFPVYDVEFLTVGLMINPIRPIPSSGNVIRLSFDDSKIPEDRFTGAIDIDLEGCTMPCHNWTTRNFGDLNTVNTWWSMSEENIVSNIVPFCCPVAECIPLEIVRFPRQ